MSANAETLYGYQFATMVELLTQQMGSRLSKAVMIGSHKGSQASPVDQLGSISMTAVTSRFAAIGRTDASMARRWCTPNDFELNQQLDSFDDLKILSDPKSKYVQNAVAAAGRKRDELILEAFFGNALTGTTGASSTSFASDGGNTVQVNFGASGNTGMTVAKLREAKRYLMAGNVDVENDTLWCAMTATQFDELLQEAQVTSRDFHEVPVLRDGRVTRFMGFNFIHTELVDVDGSSYRRVPCWAQSGMHLGIWQEPVVNVSLRNDITSIPWQAYLKMSMGATRLEGVKVVEVKCAE